MEFKEQLGEAEKLKTDLEELQNLPDLLHLHDQVAHRLFHLTRKVDVPEKIVKKELFEPTRVEVATTLVETIVNTLRVKIQLEEAKNGR